MALPNPISAADNMHMILSNSAIGTTLYMPVMRPGRIKDLFVTVGAAVATADETFTFAYAPPGSTTFTNITNGTVVQAVAASAAGTTVRQQLTPGVTCDVIDGGTIRITPSGGGSAGVPLVISFNVGP